ncbi:MAG TPA: oligoendopeptidase F [Anaeromyxobacteraceae bacterium]|nr:oligoendopeptidase F [Anaeromyxobacteraceae bacterium]
MRPARLAAALALALATTPAPAKERSEIPDKYKWNLKDLYPSVEAWKATREDLTKRIASLEQYRGHLGDSPEALWKALDATYAVKRDLSRLTVYAASLSDEDTRAAPPRELKQAAEQLGVDFAAATAWARPEILAIDPARVREFVGKEKRLADYRVPLEDLFRWKAHTLSAGEERVAAEAGNLTGAGYDLYGILANADLPWPTVKLSTGEEARLDQSGYGLHRASPVRDDREKVFAAFFGALKGFERTTGTALYATVKAHLFDLKVHRFGSSLEAALFTDNIPPTVYRQLLADVHRSLPTLHRYLALRKRVLGVETLRYQDLYAPLVPSAAMKFAPDEAREVVLQALAPLGKEYVAALKKAFESGWTDYLPSTGKRSGAYSTGVYGVHPYQLLNFNGLYEDLSTLAHESGHSMHTFLSDSTQPYPTHEYAIFVAEVASTLNENLLLRHMLSKAKDDAGRLFLLGTHLEGLRTTLFRQTQFADFELRIHEMAEKGETLTGENLTRQYLDLVRDYYGHAKGVCQVDDLLGVEWAFIPHFHYDFYVYQYATSLVASTTIARAILDQEKKGKAAARDAYLAMLKAGSSKYPIDLLKSAGVDMTTSAPFDAAMAEMNATMDEMEKILARQKKK